MGRVGREAWLGMGVGGMALGGWRGCDGWAGVGERQSVGLLSVVWAGKSG